MRVHGTFTTVFKVWKDITTLPAVRDAMVNIFGQFMDVRLDNLDNRLIQALTERWWPTTHTFLFPCAEIGVTPLDFTMLTSLSIGRYPTQVPYDDTWSILSNARQLLPNIDFSHIKSGNVSIAHLRTYLTIEADREDNINIARAFIPFMKDTIPLRYLAVVNDLESYWFYEYCGVGHPIVKEEVKYPTYPRLRAWEMGNRRKTNDQVANLFIIGRYHSYHRTVETITWEPWFDSAVSETEDVLNAKLLSRKRIPLQVPNGSCKYYLGDRCWRQVTGKVRIPLDPPLSMSPHISPAALHEMKHARFIDCLMLIDSQRMGNLDLFGPSALRAGITAVVVTSTSVHSLSQDISLPGEAEGPDLGWHMEWTGRRERLPIAHLRDPPPMSSSYESVRDAQRIQEMKEELAIAHRKIDSIDHQLYAHDLQLRRGRDVRVAFLPPEEGARTRQRRSGPQTRGGSTSRRGRGTGDDSE
ncbi:hypothetical protein GIB67_024546 [Kingdonia uniflora]|uniref:Aminotransferase-like plant mobile domain-containing protein n=1 Tax=Kingdonia uniflora TaxID=39325 RepID=A0A7J7LP31_9MAGN|nr:hypothetical protein GIB67_024546 [Kingdonia uniflora]